MPILLHTPACPNSSQSSIQIRSAVMESSKDRIKEFLDQMDSVSEKISEDDISKKIEDFIKEKFEQNPPEVLIRERMAFDFTESYQKGKSEWGTYFGPMFILTNKTSDVMLYLKIFASENGI